MHTSALAGSLLAILLASPSTARAEGGDPVLVCESTTCEIVSAASVPKGGYSNTGVRTRAPRVDRQVYDPPLAPWGDRSSPDWTAYPNTGYRRHRRGVHVHVHHHHHGCGHSYVHIPAYRHRLHHGRKHHRGYGGHFRAHRRHHRDRF